MLLYVENPATQKVQSRPKETQDVCNNRVSIIIILNLLGHTVFYKLYCAIG